MVPAATLPPASGLPWPRAPASSSVPSDLAAEDPRNKGEEEVCAISLSRTLLAFSRVLSQNLSRWFPGSDEMRLPISKLKKNTNITEHRVLPMLKNSTPHKFLWLQKQGTNRTFIS